MLQANERTWYVKDSTDSTDFICAVRAVYQHGVHCLCCIFSMLTPKVQLTTQCQLSVSSAGVDEFPEYCVPNKTHPGTRFAQCKNTECVGLL